MTIALSNYFRAICAGVCRLICLVTLWVLAFHAPFSVAPIGLSSLIWPGSEVALAKAAAKAGYGYALSTVAGASVEQVGPAAGDKGFFQLYAPNDRALAIDLMKRAKEAGFTKLILTTDACTKPARGNAYRRCAYWLTLWNQARLCAF